MMYQLTGNDFWGGFVVESDVEAISCLGRTSVRLILSMHLSFIYGNFTEYSDCEM